MKNLAQLNPSDFSLPNVQLNQANIQGILSTTFLVIGGLSILFLIIGAIGYIISNGDQGKIKQAKNTLLYAIIGIIVSTMAFAIVQFAVGVISG